MENGGEKGDTGEFDDKTTTKTRIYIGGLGGNVTEDDIRKTFSALGEVESVDFFRTKGRSFAYLDFLSSNPKSLPKLFSTYNGCTWKGGRLKLEKAKEHYLLRMKHEWEEDAQLASNRPIHDSDASESVHSVEKPKKLSTLEKAHLRIFFPKLNKMKSVPFSGTGKHKYSFQRITVPSLPIHFCDCEEHSDSSRMVEEKPSDLGTASGGMEREELNMMESVMNKLFERENCPKAASSDAKLTKKEGDNCVDPIEVLVDENGTDILSDEDNLIINVVARRNDEIPVLGSQKQKKVAADQEPTYSESKNRPVREVRGSQRKRNEPYSKKRKSPLTEVSNGNEAGPSNTGMNWSLLTLPKEEEDQITEPASRTQQSTSNISWSQKSAWKDLVDKSVDTPFQISHIVPSIPPAKEEILGSDDSKESYSANLRRQKLLKNGNSDNQFAESEDLKGAEAAALSIPSAKEEKPGSDDLNESYSANVKRQRLIEQGNRESSQPKDLKGIKAPALPNEVSNKASRGASWLQKSSWTQLVGDTSKNSFSISQVLGGLTSGNQELVQPNSTHAANLEDVKKRNLFKSDIVPRDETYEALKLTKEDLNTAPRTSDTIALSKKEQSPTGPEIEQTTTEEKKLIIRENNEVNEPTHEKRQPSGPRQASLGDFKIGETCSFMRSADSLKEWAKAKAALTGSVKKKADGK